MLCGVLFLLSVSLLSPFASSSLAGLATRSSQCAPPPATPCRENNNTCDKICSKDSCEIQAIVILPNRTNIIASLDSVSQIIEDAKTYIKENILPPWVNINFTPWDDKCDASLAQIATIDAYKGGQCVHFILGPICDFCLATVSRVLKFLGTPLLTAGGFASDFEKPKVTCDDEYFMMVRTGVVFYKGLGKGLRKLLDRHGWKKLLFLYDKNGQFDVAGQSTCSLAMQTIIQEIKDIVGFQYDDGDLGMSTLNDTDFLKQKIGTQYGIILTCVDRNRLKEILLAAESLDRMIYDGEYIFLNIDLTNRAEDPEQPWVFPETDNETKSRLEIAYNSVITLTMDTTEEQMHSKYSIGTGFYDALLLYANAIKPFINPESALANENLRINNFDIMGNMFGQKFTGYQGEVEINCNGDRINTYSIVSLNKDTQRFQKVASYREGDAELEFLEGRKIFWPSGLDSPPSDVPVCGYDKSKCPDKSLPSYVILSVIFLTVALIFITGTFFVYRRYKLKVEIDSKTWMVHWDDIEKVQEVGVRRSGSINSLSAKGSQITLCSVGSFTADRQLFIPTGIYKNTKVAIKRLPGIKIEQLKRAQLKELKEMKDLQHAHLVKFFGACLDGYNCCILTDYCSKGSLQDLLENEQFKMDFMINISLLQDIILGMIYLHESFIKSHGSLTSSNCVVDSRLVVKITDFGLHFLKQDIQHEEESHAYWRKKLWTAPELLRSEFKPGGTQKGDVYSFGIIMHEVILRQGPFYQVIETPMDPKDIVSSVMNGQWDVGNKPFRPYIDERYNQYGLLQIMEKCWAENPEDRYEFTEIKSHIKKITMKNKDSNSGNILDNLLSRMEQYANNLEHLVDERTSDYLEEKKRCEELLYQLLPRSVASQLILGQAVVAEEFSEVTIYFSDIVGFTALSAESTPLQIVELLNDLYTRFDSKVEKFDVYKVETIGDAYMVVSGLPVQNENRHAREIARMSLALLSVVHNFPIRHRPGEKLLLRIGIHSGPCVAGVVGHKMPRYCLFGDTVNTASRMESNGEALRIHVSASTKQILDTFKTFQLELRGEVEMKGKGKQLTYWLNGENSPDGISN